MTYSKLIDKYSFIFISVSILPISILAPISIWIIGFLTGLLMFFSTKEKKIFFVKPSLIEILFLVFISFSIASIFWNENNAFALRHFYELILIFIIYRILFIKAKILREKKLISSIFSYSIFFTSLFLLIDFSFQLGVKPWLSNQLDYFYTTNKVESFSYLEFKKTVKPGWYGGSYSRGLATICIFSFLTLLADNKNKVKMIFFFLICLISLYLGENLTVKMTISITLLTSLLIYIGRKFFFITISMVIGIYLFFAPLILNIFNPNESLEYKKNIFLKTSEIYFQLQDYPYRDSLQSNFLYYMLKSKHLYYVIQGKSMHRFAIWGYTSARISENYVLGKGMFSSREIGRTEKIKFKEFMLDGEKKSDKLIQKEYSYSAIPLHPHNVTLQIWLELGALGIFLYSLFLFMMWRKVIYEKRISNFQAAALSGVLINIFLINQSSYGMWQVWWLSSMVLCLIISNIVIKKSLNF